MIAAGNLLSDIPARRTEEDFAALVSSADVRIERIVSWGQASPPDFWYDQDWAEWIVLLAGAARLAIEGESVELDLKPGDHLSIPAHCRHRVAWTDPNCATVWLAVHHR